jgi:hypothetical protein
MNLLVAIAILQCLGILLIVLVGSNIPSRRAEPYVLWSGAGALALGALLSLGGIAWAG